MIPRAGAVKQRLKKRFMVYRLGLDKYVALGPQELMELGRPQGRPGIKIYDTTSDVRSKRGSQPIYHLVCAMSVGSWRSALLLRRNVPQSLGLTTLTVLFEAFKIDRKDVARGYSLLAVEEAAGINFWADVLTVLQRRTFWMKVFQYAKQDSATYFIIEPGKVLDFLAKSPRNCRQDLPNRGSKVK